MNNKEKNEINIPALKGHGDGIKVPDGYFENFALDMASRLPVNDLEQQPSLQLQPRSTWNKIRPYVYMAAMFAGVWCMMKMFSLMREGTGEMSFDNNPMITAALNDDDFVVNYVIDDYGEDALLEEMYAEGVVPADLTFAE